MKKNKGLFTILLIVFLTIAAYLLAETVDTLIGRTLEAAAPVTPSLDQARILPEPNRELREYSSVLERGLFGDGKSQSAGAAPEAAMYLLIGTVEGADFSGAVLEDAAGLQAFYRLSEKMPDGSRIVKVLPDRVKLRRPGGSTVDLQLADDAKIVNVPKGPATGGVRKLSEGKWAVDQREVASNTENISQVLTQARALPYMENGKTIGFRMTEIVPGSIFERMGIQNGDVVQRVNAQDVDDPGKFFQLYQTLKEEKNITIDLMRAGHRQTLNYEIR